MTTTTPRSNREWRELAEQAQRELAAANERIKMLESRLTAMTQWLEREQPDVFRRGIWDAIREAK